METKQKKFSFIYEGKPFSILSTGKEKFREIIQKFIKELNPESRIIDYNFYYERVKI